LSVRNAVSERTKIFAANRALGHIALAVAANGAVTRRARVREEGSLRVRCPGSDCGELEAVIVNTAGGVAGGDCFNLDVMVAPGARLVVTTAAAEKVYRALDAAAEIELKLSVGAGGSLAWLPQETILFDRARLRRSIEIELDDDARLVLAEAVVFGRSGMGEVVEDGDLVDRWRLRRGGHLIHAETLRLDGAIAAKLKQAAVANGAIAIATMLVVPGNDDTAARLRGLNGSFHGEVGISAWNGIVVARLCAPSGAALRHDLAALLAAARGAALPRLWVN
jgi:urease accessory protein